MLLSAVAAGILYTAMVSLLGLITVKLRIVTKPPFKKSILPSALFYIGIIFAMLAVFLYESSRITAVLFGLIGVIIGVFKTSGDCLRSRDATDFPDAAGQKSFETLDPNGAAAGGPVPAFYQPVNLNVVKGRGSFFVNLYMLLAVFFSFSVTFLVLSVVYLFIAGVIGKVRPDDIAVYFKLIASFDFHNSAMKNTSEAQTGAMLTAYAAAAAIALLIFALIFGILLWLFKRQSLTQRTVAALMPVRRQGFVPCAEGVYKLCYRNLLTGSRFYRLYLWGSLSLYAIDEKKKRVVLKASKLLIPLTPWDKESGQFEGLKAIVFRYLSGERQRLPAKKIGYRWLNAAIAVLIILSLQAVFANRLDKAVAKGAGTDYCDVSGKIHYSFRRAFETKYNYFVMHRADGKTTYKFCEMHFMIYVILHPEDYIPAFRSLVHENKVSPSPVRSVMIVETFTLPAIIWIDLLIFTFYVGKPRRTRFNVL